LRDTWFRHPLKPASRGASRIKARTHTHPLPLGGFTFAKTQTRCNSGSRAKFAVSLVSLGWTSPGGFELGRPLETDVELSADSARCRWGGIARPRSLSLNVFPRPRDSPSDSTAARPRRAAAPASLSTNPAKRAAVIASWPVRRQPRSERGGAIRPLRSFRCRRCGVLPETDRYATFWW
jgi:hypothetical protein